MVKCKICEKEFEKITAAHLKTHNRTLGEYRAIEEQVKYRLEYAIAISVILIISGLQIFDFFQNQEYIPIDFNLTFIILGFCSLLISTGIMFVFFIIIRGISLSAIYESENFRRVLMNLSEDIFSGTFFVLYILIIGVIPSLITFLFYYFNISKNVTLLLLFLFLFYTILVLLIQKRICYDEPKRDLFSKRALEYFLSWGVVSAIFSIILFFLIFLILGSISNNNISIDFDKPVYTSNDSVVITVRYLTIRTDFLPEKTKIPINTSYSNITLAYGIMTPNGNMTLVIPEKISMKEYVAVFSLKDKEKGGYTIYQNIAFPFEKSIFGSWNISRSFLVY